MVKLAILIPFRTDNDIREQHFHWTYNRLSKLLPDANIYVGGCDEGPFNRSQAINNAFKQTKGEEVLFISDGDVALSSNRMKEAINKIHDVSSYIVPYWGYLSMDRSSTERFMSDPLRDNMADHQYSYETVADASPTELFKPPLSGATFITSENFRKVGGFDEKFVGWGYEDNAFAKMACHILGNYTRLGDHLWHLWHLRGPETTWESPTIQSNHWRWHLYNEDIESMKYDYL